MVTIIETAIIEKAMDMERKLPPGDYTMKLTFLNPLSPQQFVELDNAVNGGAEILSPIEEDMRSPSTVTIKFRKPANETRGYIGIFPVAALLSLISVALIPILIGIGIFKIEKLSSALLPVILTAGGFVVIVVALLRRPAEAAAVKYLERR